MTVLAILQARMSSARLPGKVLMDLVGNPMIFRQIERLKECSLIDDIVVATSVDKSDDPLVNYLNTIGMRVHRGSLNDVLDRFATVAELSTHEVCVRLTADCPLADPKIIDEAIALYKESNFDYVSNCLPRTYPKGLDVEVFSRETIIDLNRSKLSAESREHVTMSIYSDPKKFKLGNLSQHPSQANHRWTVDYQKDLDFIRIVYKNLYTPGKTFFQGDILSWLKNFPEFNNLEDE
jgi:spore coat polysaccharide biosynthesis protein SpsF